MDSASVVREYFAAWRRGDVERLRALLDDQVSATGPLAAILGAEEHAASLVRSRAMFRDIAVDHLLAEDGFVISWFRFQLRSGGEVRAANRCEVADGRITAVEVTFDPRPLIAEAR
jgi:ketosteroid isomerase-like protein